MEITFNCSFTSIIYKHFVHSLFFIFRAFHKSQTQIKISVGVATVQMKLILNVCVPQVLSHLNFVVSTTPRSPWITALISSSIVSNYFTWFAHAVLQRCGDFTLLDTLNKLHTSTTNIG